MAKKLSDADYETLFNNAFLQAAFECGRYLGTHPGEWFPCGFAWVVFSGRDPAVSFLKKSYPENDPRRGSKGYPKGWHIWDPSRSGTQCMEAKMAGARAFAKVFTDAGIDCYADCRMD